MNTKQKLNEVMKDKKFIFDEKNPLRITENCHVLDFFEDRVKIRGLEFDLLER